MARWIALAALMVACIVMAVLFLPESRPEATATAALLDEQPPVDGLSEGIARLQPEGWVDHFEPERCFIGYNLVLYRRRLPMLIDMNGRIVHAWPQVRVYGRARLDHDGNLIVVGRDERIKRYDWYGRLEWSLAFGGGDFPHHDFIELDNGNYLLVVRSMADNTDYLVEVDSAHNTVWQWQSRDHLGRTLPPPPPPPRDPVHINSVHEIPRNRWFDAGDERFQPGNILVSARNLNTVFIIARNTGEIVWSYSDNLDYQHEASMIGAGELWAGLIVYFNNGYHNVADYRRSAVVALDPVARRTSWSYSEEGFYSSVGGAAHVLPNGNVQVVSSVGGRAFEITPDGDLVWQWQPPFRPIVAPRYATSHCPQLAALPAQETRAVYNGDDRPFQDIETFSFLVPEEWIDRTVYGRLRHTLPSLDECRELWIPEDARIGFSYGFNEEELAGRHVVGSFSATISHVGGSDTTVLIDDTLDSSADEPWVRKVRPLEAFARKRVNLCLRASARNRGDRDDSERLLVWENPRVTSSAYRLFERRKPLRTTREDEELKLKQLQAIGYLQ